MTSTKISIGQFKLDYLHSNYSQLARQGSEAWLRGRLTRFGGSEVGRVVRTKKSLSKLIKEKIEKTFKTNIYCWWGNTFEPIAKEYLEFSKKVKIYDFGAVPSSNYPIAYSPDGVFIDPESQDLRLLEIKCPFLRDVHYKTDIKDDYMKQIQTGMQILPCDKASFIQFKFRKCSYEQLKTPGKYNRYFHRELKRSPEQIELWHGAIYWNTNECVRYGIVQTVRPYKIYYSFKEKVSEICESYNSGCILYFKCFFVLENVIPKDRDFEARYSQTIWNGYNDLINEYKNSKK